MTRPLLLSVPNIFLSLALSVALSVALTTGCSLNTGDTLPPPPPRQMKLPQLLCINPSISVLKNYFHSVSTDEEVGAAWSCLDGALGKFVSETRGAKPDSFTTRELRTFFEIYYLNGQTISDDFLRDIMKLKQLLVGGDNKTLTKVEIQSVRNSLGILKVESLRLRPYIPYLLMKATPEEARANPAQVEAALAALTTSSHNLSLIFSHDSIIYTQEDIKSLLRNVGLLIGDWDGPDKLIDYLPVFALVKEFIAGGRGDQITAAEFLPLMDRIGRLAAIHLRATYFIAKADITKSPALDHLQISLDQTVTLLTEIAKTQPGQVISFTKSEELIDEVAQLGLISSEFPRDSAKKAFRLVVQKLLASPLKTDSGSSGIDLQTIDAIHTIGRTYIERQRAWEQLATASATQGLTANGQPVPVVSAKRLWPNFYQHASLSGDEIAGLLARSYPVTFVESGAIDFSSQTGFKVISDNSFVRMNVMSLLERVIVSGYGKSSPRSLTHKEFATFFNDFFGVAQSFKLLQPKDQKLGQSIFDEANMFTFDARNDSKMGDFELFDYIGEMMGAGVMTQRAYDSTAANCRAVGVDFFKRNTYAADCFRQTAADHFSESFAELPEWVRLAKRMKANGSWTDFETALESAGRDDGYSSKAIEQSDINHMAMVMHYIESLYVRFDRDHSGDLDYDEAMKALPLFDQLLRQASGFKDGKKRCALFMYILAKGHAPKSLGDKLDFILSWSRKPSKWTELHADRFRLLNVVAAMATKP